MVIRVSASAQAAAATGSHSGTPSGIIAFTRTRSRGSSSLSSLRARGDRINYLAIYNEVSANFSTTVTSRAKVWVNWAYHEFLDRRRWSFLETSSAAVALVASQQGYVLTGTSPVITDFAGMISVTLEMTASGSRHKMWEADAQTFEAMTAHSRVIGVPALFTVQGGTAASTSSAVVSGGQTALQLWPIPVATAGNGVNLFLRYDRSAAGIELSADSDVPIIPVSFHSALILGATAYGMAAYNQPQEAAQWKQMFLSRIEEAARADSSTRNRDSQRIAQVQQPFLYPIVGQSQATFDPSADPLPVPTN